MPLEDAINYATEGKPVEFGNVIKDSLADRILASIEAKRQETANHLFGTPVDIDVEPDHSIENHKE